MDIDLILSYLRHYIKNYKSDLETKELIFSKCILNILSYLDISNYINKEYTILKSTIPETLYKNIIILYKDPSSLSSDTDIQASINSFVDALLKEIPNKEEWIDTLGIILSDKILFVKYNLHNEKWEVLGLYDINRENIIRLIEAIKGLKKKALKLETIIKDFGIKADITKKAVKLFYKKLSNTTNIKTNLLFEEWIRLFKLTTGSDLKKLKNLDIFKTSYNLTEDIDYDKLLFAIQTYYSLILKLITAEVVYIFGCSRFYKTYIIELYERYQKEGLDSFKKALTDLETGELFKMYGYLNFPESDYFSWYLNELDSTLAEVILEIIKKLDDYLLTTAQIDLEYAKDLLKGLYQDLIPREIRHKLGEYYTPEWLADLILRDIGLSIEDLEKIGSEDILRPLSFRILDPACGSGTFLVRSIMIFRLYARKHNLEDIIVDYITNNIIGYDLNPLAVLTAKTNYLLMIADLPKKGMIEIPIYLADSILVEKKKTILGDIYELKTTAGIFQIPDQIIKKGLLLNIISEISKALQNKYPLDKFRDILKTSFNDLSPHDIDILLKLYNTLLKLNEINLSHTWLSIIKSTFIPLTKEKFDFVIGNPPWICWDNLPKDYREISKYLWEKYGLVAHGLRLKRDLSMLFFARCFDLYLKDGGYIAFVMPLNILKTQAGFGFRKFLITKTKVTVIYDLTTTRPFGDVLARTSVIIAKKEESSINKEIKHLLVYSERPIPPSMHLNEVLKKVKIYELVLIPASDKDITVPWMQITKELVQYFRKINKASSYKAYYGINPRINQVFYVRIKEKLPDGKLKIINTAEAGYKRKVKEVETIIEEELVYPLLSGRNIKKWRIIPEKRYVIIPHDLKNGDPIPENILKEKYPLTYSYFQNYAKELKELKKRRVKIPESWPEYSISGVSPKLLFPYKVIWGTIAGDVFGKASFKCVVLENVKDPILDNKPYIVNKNIVYIPTDSKEEAYYLSGVLNSTILRVFSASFNVETTVKPSTLEWLYIPKYDKNNPLHNQIAQISLKIHELVNQNAPKEEIHKLEKELDYLILKLYDFPEEVLHEAKKLSQIFKIKDAPPA